MSFPHLDARAVHVSLDAATPESVIAQLAARLQALGVVAPGYAAAVLAREAEMPTGLPLADDFAVAVPHTDPEHVLKPGLAVATLRQPVPFRSMEDPAQALPVRVVFALALKDKNEQIDMLRRVAALLQDGARLRRLADADSVAAVMEELGAAGHGQALSPPV